MDSLKLANFLFLRIQETIDYKEYIASVSIDYERAETYGNDYIQVSYTILANENFERLSYNEKQGLFHKTPNYTFSLSTNKERYKYDAKRKLLRIIEFKNIYESLAAYVVLQLENHLDKEIPIKVNGIDLWPEANYAEKYLLADVNGSPQGFFDFKQNVSIWSSLHRLAKKSNKIYTKEKEYFSITDIEINSLFKYGFTALHSILVENEVPIKVKGIKTIHEIHIHTAKLAKALKKEINSNEFVRKYSLEVYKYLVTYLYDKHLKSEKIKIVNHLQSEYLKCFIIQKGDILQLKNDQIVMANSISIDEQNMINVEYVILKKDLQPGQRMRIVKTSEILYILKRQLYLEFASKTPFRHLSLLKKWILNTKAQLDIQSFESDMTRVDID